MKLDDFMPFILTDVLGCSDPLAKAHLVQAAIEFCGTTKAWNEIQDPISLLPGVSMYDIDAPSGAEMNVILGAWYGGRAMSPVGMHQLQLAVADWMKSSSSDPVYYNQAADRNQVQVFPTPNELSTEPLVLRVSFTPSRSAIQLPDFLGSRYMDAITSGTKSRLMSIPGQPWTNPGMSQYHRSIFMDGVSSAHAELMHERVVGTTTARPRSFGF